MIDKPHALYRFYNAQGELLYIGITHDPGQRWLNHQVKPWWSSVAQIQLETYPDRTSVLNAERAAIIAERPRHNVIHNRGTIELPRSSPQLDRISPIQVGDWGAFGLKDGRCPVGQVEAFDETWLSVRQKNFLGGWLDHQVVAFRWVDVEAVELAYPEDAIKEDNHREMQDEHLGTFQSAWFLLHSDPLGDAKGLARKESQAVIDSFARRRQ